MEAFNRFQITVHAVDIRRGVEGSKYGILNVYNSPPFMGTISTYPWMGGGMFSWPMNKEVDFLGYRIKSWLVKETGETGYVVFTEQTSSTYIRQLNEIEKNEGYIGINVLICAIDTFGNESIGSAADLVVDSLNIKPTDIEGFALSASRMFSTAIVLEGEQFFSNSQDQGSTASSGYVSWNAHSLFLRGVEFKINAGSSNSKYIYFKTIRRSFPTLEEAKSSETHPIVYNCIYEGSNVHPADAGLISLNFDSGNYGQIIAVNTGGFYDLAWNATANEVIGSAYIMKGAINDAHINSLSAGKITAGSAFIGGVSIGGLTTIDVSLGAAGELPKMPDNLPEGLYITRDFIGYYCGPYNLYEGSIIKNGKGTISVSNGSNIVIGTGTNFKEMVLLADPSNTINNFFIVIAMVSDADYGLRAVSFEFTRQNIVSDTQINLLNNSGVTYSGRYNVSKSITGVAATNKWAYIFKSDGTLALQEGGKIIVGDKNIIIDTEGDTNSIIVAPDGGKDGHDYLQMKDGNLIDFFWNGTSHVAMKALKNISVGTCVSGSQCTISGNFKPNQTPTVLILAPSSVSSHSSYTHMPFNIVAQAGTVSAVTAGGTQYKFTPKIGIEYKAGGEGRVPVGYVTFDVAVSGESIFDQIDVIPGCTSTTLNFSCQVDIDGDLAQTTTLVFTLQYYKNSSWYDGGSITTTLYNLVNYGKSVSCSDGSGFSAVRLKKTYSSGNTAAVLKGTVNAMKNTLGSAYFYENSAQAQYIAFGANS